MQPCFLLVKSLITGSAEQGDTAMHRQPVNLFRYPKKNKSSETIGVPTYSDMNRTHGGSQTDPCFSELCHKASLCRPLLNELPLSGCEHRNLASQNQAFLAENTSRL